METLHKIADDYLALQDLLDEGDDEAVRNTLDGVEHSLSEKIDNIAGLMNHWTDCEANIAAEIKRLQDRKKMFTNRKARLKNYLLYSLQRMNRPKVETDLHTVYVRKGAESTYIEDMAKLPEDFIKIEYSPNKAMIKDHLKAGETIPGAHLERGPDTVVIK